MLCASQIQDVHILNKSCLRSNQTLVHLRQKAASMSRGMHQRREIPTGDQVALSSPTHLMKYGSAECLERGGVKIEPGVPLKVSFSVSHFLCVGVLGLSLSVYLSLSLSPQIVHLAWSWLQRNGFDLLCCCRPLLFTL